ncbi:MAG: cysteine desulfurase family protein [Verrucomicrobiota bacterium]|nr:cysteine desulfurase family protein [Verrucomicrobiota bacterium]
MIHLDHIITTKPLPEVVELMQPWLNERFGSPILLGKLGIEARDALDEARSNLAKLINAANDEEIIFTSSGTEAINHAVKGSALANKRFGNHIITTNIEHPAITGSIDWLENQGFKSSKIKVDNEGRFDPNKLAELIQDDTILVCLHQANHDLGTIQPIAKAAELTGQHGIPLFIDATVSGGWLPINVQQLGVDLLALAPHRFYGPKGVGVLYKKRSTPIDSLIHGGMQENNFRSGTENIAAIVGAGIASIRAISELDKRFEHTSKLQHQLLNGIRQKVKGIHLNGPEPGYERLPHHLNISTEGVEGEGQTLALDLRGVAIHAGSACITKSMQVPPYLAAIGRNPDLARGTTLWGIGITSNEAQISEAIEIFSSATNNLRSILPSKNLLK